MADDRTLTATAVVPAGFPNGYAELSAIDQAGTTWTTFVLIGERLEGPVDRAPIDERAIWMAAFAVGLGIVAIALSSTGA